MAGSQQLNPQEVMAVQLAVLRQEHRDLDVAISALVDRAGDQLTVKRLKQKKLHLKDQIAKLEDELTPDIIA
ncbi:YdcH family protein [Planktomarina sp.]|uniref:YdcH family protein n=1 Tax=Planktomarina sp. TaxID=2024851 RepID=UPI003C52F130